MIDEALLSILVCPQCKGPVSYQEQREELWCKACMLCYPIRKGIPVMLLDEARAALEKEFDR